jgi:CheY-like chemotaxis protein
MAAQALEASRQGAALTRRMLAFSRRQELEPRIVDPNQTVAGAIKMLKRTLGDNIEILVHTADDLGLVHIDPNQLESAILNLAVNARDAMPDGGILTIETARQQLDEDYVAAHPEAKAGEYVAIAVSDTGCGMPPEVMERAFEPFFTTKESGKGTGLGLSMVFGFIKQSGGQVSLYSEVGYGTTVKLYLPQTALAKEAKPVPVDDAADLPTGGETILVVEDNQNVRRIVTRQLRSLRYRVLEAANGHAALEALRSGVAIDLVFTDILMPGGMSGRDLALQVRQVRPTLKILFTSGFTAAGLTASNLAEIRPQLLSKPYRYQDLARKVREVLDQR